MTAPAIENNTPVINGIRHFWSLSVHFPKKGAAKSPANENDDITTPIN